VLFVRQIVSADAPLAFAAVIALTSADGSAAVAVQVTEGVEVAVGVGVEVGVTVGICV
jgi:chaperone required for assembly of F1-ATPase